MVKKVIIFVFVSISFFSCSTLDKSLKTEGVYKFTFQKYITTLYYMKKDGELLVKSINYGRQEKNKYTGGWEKVNDSIIVIDYKITDINRRIVDTLDVVKTKNGYIYSLQNDMGSKYYKRKKLFIFL